MVDFDSPEVCGYYGLVEPEPTFAIIYSILEKKLRFEKVRGFAQGLIESL